MSRGSQRMVARPIGSEQGQASPLSTALPHFWWSSKPPMKHNVLGVPRLSIFRAAPIAKWQQAAGLPKNAFTSNGITALGLLPFHQKCGRAANQVALRSTKLIRMRLWTGADME